jgi:hypothetical protein
VTSIPWRAQPGPQLTAIRLSLIDELFYGGAVGGGKSDFLLGDFAQDVPSPWGAHWHGILFRKTYPELEELVSRSQEIYPFWFPRCKWLESKSTWVFPNGATLKLRYLEHATDWMRYWGHQYGWIGWDELPSWPNMMAYNKLKARLRSAHAIPNKRIRATGNPGGPGHSAVKQYFRIDANPEGGKVYEINNAKRMFIRSRVTDNQLLLRNDPTYIDRLKGLGSPELVRAWLDGDWNVVSGAFFPEFNAGVHVVAPKQLPKRWLKFRAMDWGSAKPFCVLWFAVSDGDMREQPYGDTPAGVFDIPKGALVVYREWYGVKTDEQGVFEPNVGLKLTAEQLADGILERERKDETTYCVIDPSAFAQNGGPSIAERMGLRGVYSKAADNRRVATLGAIGGWDQVRQRLQGEDDKPMLYITSTCQHLIRTLPVMQHDEDHPEDLNSDGEDHAVDALRYGCMSRPWTQPKPTNLEPPRGARTIKEMADRYEAREQEIRRI